MNLVIISGIPLLIVLIVYYAIYKKVEEKEKQGKEDMSDAFLLLLVGVGFGTPFSLIFVGSIFMLLSGG